MQLAYETAGTGPAVVFVHAGIADRRMWASQVPTFAVHFATVTCDLRGFGESEMVDEPYSDRQDLADLLDALSIESAHIVGCSLGGATALEFAVAFPDRVNSLVLVNSAAPGFVPEGGHFEPAEDEEATMAYEAGDLDRAAALEVEMWVVGHSRDGVSVSAEIRDFVFEMNRRALTTDSRRETWISYLEPPAATRLEEVRCPALIVVGELDMPDILPTGEYIAAGIADGRLVSIAGTAHLPNMERPPEFNRVVRDFLTTM